MHTPTAPKSKVITFTVTTPRNVPKGHNAHRSGSGKHDNSRNKRLNTRSAKTRQAMQE